MKNPLFNKLHIREYLLYGFIAAILYFIPTAVFLYNNRYENAYYLFIGSCLFMLVIFYYVMRLLNRPYDRKRAFSMVIAGHLATLAGVVISCVLVAITILLFFPSIYSSSRLDTVIENVTPTEQPHRSSQLLFITLVMTILCNFGVGSFIAIMVAYAGKKDQTKDVPPDLNANIPPSKEG